MESWPHRLLQTVPGPQVCQELATRVREVVLENPESKCRMSAVCEAGGFTFRIAQIATEHRYEGVLVALPSGGFTITVDPEATGPVRNAQVRRQRIRFRLAHEIGHSFFYDRRSAPARRARPASPAEEKFCHRFASALLVPPQIASVTPLEPEALIALGKKFDVSVQVASFAVARSRPGLAVALLEPRRHPKTSGPPRMRVVWGAGSDHYIPSSASVRDDWLQQAQRAQRGAVYIPDFKLGSLRGGCRIHVRSFGDGRSKLLFAQQAVPDAPGSADPGGDNEQLTLGSMRTRTDA